MQSICRVIALLLILSLASLDALALETKTKVVLTKKNTVILRGVVTDESVAKLEVDLYETSTKLKPNEVIYLVLDTPGGSVDAGEQLIDFIHGLPNQVKTLSLFAASMGFHIAENLGERLVIPSSVMMSHRASLGGLSGEVPGEYIVRLKFIMRDLKRMNAIAATRMCVSLKKYEYLIRDQLWVKGREAVTMKMADRVVYAQCDQTFQGTSDVELGEFLGVKVFGKMSNCPLITGVLGIHLDAPESATKEDVMQARRMADMYSDNKTEFVKQFIAKGELIFH